MFDLFDDDDRRYYRGGYGYGAYDYRLTSWLFFFFVVGVILLCLCGLGCCGFLFWKKQQADQQNNRAPMWSRSQTPVQASYIV